LQPDSVEAVGNVDLRQRDWPVARVGMDDAFEDAVQCMPELHRFVRGEPNGLLVNV
jgi:hypothetical protein